MVLEIFKRLIQGGVVAIPVCLLAMVIVVLYGGLHIPVPTCQIIVVCSATAAGFIVGAVFPAVARAIGFLFSHWY
ncbi:hypothetical protein FF098_010340 [Parvularcula flava]|uniref:Uncharacterized protein n=1 Tax=Aquisalinus luteolus TaxID=1566827 RepID=A0ABX0HM85_9PROT|nr:hypothetical protein [Aquisalinus luteolus]NHK28304.1 hypothetical protein [Aquisalinus luteolus]